MTADQFQKLVCLGRYIELDDPKYESFNELLKLQLKIAHAIVCSIRKRMYSDATSLQIKYDCIAMVKGESKTLQELRNELTSIKNEMKEARAYQKMDRFASLFQRRNGVWTRLQSEVDSIVNGSACFNQNDQEVLDLCCLRQHSLEKLVLHVQDVFVECLLSTDTYVDSKFMKLEKLPLKAVIGDLWSLDHTSLRVGEAQTEQPLLTTIDEDGEKSDSSTPQADSDESEAEITLQTTKTQNVKIWESVPSTCEDRSSHEKKDKHPKGPSLNRQTSSRTITTVGSTVSGSISSVRRSGVLSEWKSPTNATSDAQSDSSFGLRRRSSGKLQSSFSNSSLVGSVATLRSSTHTPISSQASMESNESVPWWRDKDGEYDEEEGRSVHNKNRIANQPNKRVARKIKKNCQPCGVENCCRMYCSLHAMTCRSRKEDRRWQTGASNEPKDLQLPTVVRYSPSSSPEGRSQIQRNSMLRD
jgi:hypothetical protein